MEFAAKGCRVDHQSAPSAADKSVQKMIGDGASGEVEGSAMRFFEKVATIVCFISRDTVMGEGLDQWFAYFSFPEFVFS